MTTTTYQEGEFDQRPWGTWKVVSATADYILKHIEVSPGCRLSLQYHNHRSEHWIVVKGRGEVTIGGDTISVERGSHIYVPRETKHRISNTGPEALEFVELQFGTVLDEMDIVRIEDDYER